MTMCICQQCARDVLFTYTIPPKGETLFSFRGDYYREVSQCGVCGHVRNHYGFDFDPETFYRMTYNQVTYGDRFRQEYDRIMALPFGESNNKQRVESLLVFLSRYGLKATECVRVLDVGSGLCVFLAELKRWRRVWKGTALDPDPRVVIHARNVVEVEAIEGQWGGVEPVPYNIGMYDLVTFNNVIEHVPYPVRMLTQAKDYLTPHGLVYVEVPDGEEAVKRGRNAPELFVEHLHAFSVVSLALAIVQAGLTVLRIDRVVVPNGNLTLRGYSRG